MCAYQIYREAGQVLRSLPDSLSNSNAGLWFNKFGVPWPDGEIALTPDIKSSWINKVATGEVGQESELEAMATRMEQLAVGRGEIFEYKTTSGFVSGLGSIHPLENGFIWHHTLGVPYIPGSSIKGMVRAWAGEWQGDGEVERIFGPEGEAARKNPASGSVAFLDALPVSPVKLKAEVMTPHYKSDYSEKDPPGDWLNPNPIKFLTVDSGNIFQFGLLQGPNYKEDDLEKVKGWLAEALEYIGAGAKTAVGFGRFEALIMPD